MNAEFVLLSFANYCEVKMFKIKIGDYWRFCCYKPFFNFTETIKEYKKYIKKMQNTIRMIFQKQSSVIMIYGFWRKYENK